MEHPEIGAEPDKKLIARIFDRISKIPIMDTLHLEVAEIKAGYCELKAPRRKSYDGIFESFHGGLLMTVADSAAAYALMTLTGPEVKMTTTDMNIRFLAPCLTDPTARARLSNAAEPSASWPWIFTMKTKSAWRWPRSRISYSGKHNPGSAPG